MSNYNSDRKLDLIINLLETLPKRMCNEYEKREEANKLIKIEEINSILDSNKDLIEELLSSKLTKSL